jgi:urease accessory protein
MLTLTKHQAVPHQIASVLLKRAAVLALPFIERSKSRFKAHLVDGREVGVVLPRGTVLRGGDILLSEAGDLVRIEAAPEQVVLVRSPDGLSAHEAALMLLRAAYHLGNRHTPVEIQADCLKLEADSVLADMLRRLGLNVAEIEAPFEPEAGAYGGGHKHGHDDSFAEDYALAQAAFVHHHGHEHDGSCCGHHH